MLRQFDYFLDRPPQPLKLKERTSIWLKVDAKYFGRWGCVVVFKERKNILFWELVDRESYLNYCRLFGKLAELGYDLLGMTSDWHGSLVSVFANHFRGLPHQRCLVHTQRFCQALITKRPETEAGERLLEIVRQLNRVKTHNDKDIWLKWFGRWEGRYQPFINQRTYQDSSRHWWFTHKNLRRAYRTLKLSLDNLFLYLDHSGLDKDTNGLEAEFTHLKHKLNSHRGMTRKRKASFIRWYFFFKSQPENC